ncbi:hypothetical protein K6V33_07055 [Streptococcus suis]|nr:hypothetical protein [Streptococcus suis]
MKKIKSLTNEFSQKIISLIKEHKKIVLIEVAILVIYGCIAFLVVNDNKKYLEIFFSSEVLVSLLIAAGAIYSWMHHKEISDTEISNARYENDLQLLRNIDEILEEYKNRGEERTIGVEFEDFLSSLEPKFIIHKTEPDPREQFLDLYYRFISDKVDSDNESEENLSYQSDSLDVLPQSVQEHQPTQNIKDIISKRYHTSINNVRFSKNYEDDARRYNLRWTTWFNLKENIINNMDDMGKQFFITRLDDEYLVFQIAGRDLKKMILDSQVKPRKRKQGGKIVYDFFFGQDLEGNFVEGRHKINLESYNIVLEKIKEGM